MTSSKEFELIVDKPEDYLPIPDDEKWRVVQIMATELFELAERFDGSCSIKIKIEMEAKGNA